MNKLVKNERVMMILIPVVSAILGLIAGAVIMLLGGYDPMLGYQSLFDGMFGTPKAIGETIRAMTPLALAGIAVAFAYKTGLFTSGHSYSFSCISSSCSWSSLGVYSRIFKSKISCS
jgi:simple sugar transport system permease protein